MSAAQKVEGVSATPTWADVEKEIRRLAETGDRFDTAVADDNRLMSYEPDRRVALVNTRGTSFVEIASIRECWEKLETKGKIRRRDVLEPGRCSAFMMALFARISGVQVEQRDEEYLILPK